MLLLEIVLFLDLVALLVIVFRPRTDPYEEWRAKRKQGLGDSD